MVRLYRKGAFRCPALKGRAERCRLPDFSPHCLATRFAYPENRCVFLRRAECLVAGRARNSRAPTRSGLCSATQRVAMGVRFRGGVDIPIGVYLEQTLVFMGERFKKGFPVLSRCVFANLDCSVYRFDGPDSGPPLTYRTITAQFFASGGGQYF